MQPRQADWAGIGASKDPVNYLGTIKTGKKNKESNKDPAKPTKRRTYPVKPDDVSAAVYPDKFTPSLATP